METSTDTDSDSLDIDDLYNPEHDTSFSHQPDIQTTLQTVPKHRLQTETETLTEAQNQAQQTQKIYSQDQELDEIFDEAETYSNYQPQKLKYGKPHPDVIVESASMSAVTPPDIWYKSSIESRFPEVFKNGKLSNLQIEALRSGRFIVWVFKSPLEN